MVITLWQRAITWCAICLAFALAGTALAQAPDTWRALIDPDNSLSFIMLKGESRVFTTGIMGWGPNWGWASIGSKTRATGDVLELETPFTVNKAANQVITIKQRVEKKGENTVVFTYTLTAPVDVPLTSLNAMVGFMKEHQAGDAVCTLADGKESKIPLSFSGRGGISATKAISFISKTGGTTTASLEPALPLTWDNGLRITLAEKLFKAGTQTVILTYTFPAATALLAKQADLDALTQLVPQQDWFPVTATNSVDESVIGFESWLEKPAGKRGIVQMKDDKFQFADGTPVKFWGTNLSYAYCAPEKATGEFTAKRFAKYGVNAVRLHKFSGKSGWEGIGDPNDATKMVPAGQDKLDYFADQLAKNGVYYGFSHTFGFRVRAGNKDHLLAYDEIMKNKSDGSTSSLINYAEDVQDLMIEMVVNLLKHKNPYTGKTYAEDPALCFVELQNEDDIFWYATSNVYDDAKYPIYSKYLRGRYSDWLQNKYVDQAGLQKAWGGALKANETLAAKNIGLQGNPWFMGEDNMVNQTGVDRQRLLDNAAFFHDVQNQFYSKFNKAIRDAGYQGPICGSPWQAPSGLPHYYNLKSDYLAGFIDRHNYFGGAANGLNTTLLGKPGSGNFSTGLQQVVDRPFGISEWIHVYPSLYSAEGPALFATYGMGLQGWDLSYQFQSTHVRKAYGDIVGVRTLGVWNADAPTQIGQFPALARMIARGDVKEGAVIGTRVVTPQNLQDGKFDFSDKVVQSGDVKEFTGNTPPEALAAGRLVVKFTDEKDAKSTFPDMKLFEKDKVITSNTNQLLWDYSGKGFFALNSEGTKAVVGFADGKEVALGTYKIKVACPYASIFLTSLEKDADLTKTKSALITAVARNSNSNFKVFALDNRIIDNGKTPIMMEPVKATITVGRDVAAVNVLDQDGKRTGKTLPVEKNVFTLDSAQDKTIYYEIVYK